jgi:hypothetical protein
LYGDITPNNTEIPSTKSGAGDIRIFGRRIELKYSNPEKRDTHDAILEDIELLLESKVEFCIVALRFDYDHKDGDLVRAVDLPLLRATRAVAPIAIRKHSSANYYGPGIFLPACFVHEIKRITRDKKKTNSYLSVEQVHNLERSCFLQIGPHLLHVDVIGSREDGLLTFLYKRADQVRFEVKVAAQDVTVPYSPAPIRIASIERGDVFASPQLPGRKSVEIEKDVPRLVL